MAIPLFSDELVAAVAPDHPLADRGHLEPRDFAGRTLVLHSHPADSLIVRSFLSPAGIEPGRILELRLSEAVIEMVRSGLGITAMAWWAIAPQVEAGRLVAIRLGEHGLRRDWHAAVTRRRADWPPIRSLLRMLRGDALAMAERSALGTTRD